MKRRFEAWKRKLADAYIRRKQDASRSASGSRDRAQSTSIRQEPEQELEGSEGLKRGKAILHTLTPGSNKIASQSTSDSRERARSTK